MKKSAFKPIDTGIGRNTFELVETVLAVLGFEPAFRCDFPHLKGDRISSTESQGYNETFIVYGHPERGVVATLDTYSDFADGKYVERRANIFRIWYSFQQDPGSRVIITGNYGTWESESDPDWKLKSASETGWDRNEPHDIYLAGDYDAGDRLRVLLAKFERNGKFLNPWPRQPFRMRMFLHWAETRDPQRLLEQKDNLLRTAWHRYRQTPAWFRKVTNFESPNAGANGSEVVSNAFTSARRWMRRVLAR